MSHYVVGDIHGCYDELQKMIKKIRLKDDDELIMVGDYIDRGDQNVEMMEWLYEHPPNVIPIRGNHDENFAYYIDLMDYVEELSGRQMDPDSNPQAALLYVLTKETLNRRDPVGARYFDMYGTIGRILSEETVTLSDLRRYAAMFRSFPLSYRVDGVVSDTYGVLPHRPCVIVHAGYREDLFDEEDKKRFFLEARRPAYTEGGLRDGMVIAGHTPTFIEREFTYSKKGVFRYEDRSKNCIYYDIDCGCVFRERYSQAKLACIRLEDEKIRYV